MVLTFAVDGWRTLRRSWRVVVMGVVDGGESGVDVCRRDCGREWAVDVLDGGIERVMGG